MLESDDRAAPTRQEVRQRMLDLLTGRQTREEVADWAAAWVRKSEPKVDDIVVWEGLVSLSGADLLVDTDEYLHTEPDFRQWLDALEAGN